MSDKNKLVSDAAKEFRLQSETAKTQAKLEAVTFRKERETQLISEARKIYMAKLDAIYSGKYSPTTKTSTVTRSNINDLPVTPDTLDAILSTMETDEEDDNLSNLTYTELMQLYQDGKITAEQAQEAISKQPQ